METARRKGVPEAELTGVLAAVDEMMVASRSGRRRGSGVARVALAGRPGVAVA